MEKDFDRWNRIKKATDAADESARLYFREGEVWWVRLGKNIGYETNGKSREFTRPVIILKKYNQYSFLALPLTTAPKPNPYRLPIGMIDGRQAFATLSQLRNIDSQKDRPYRRRYPRRHKERGQPRKLRLASSVSFAPLSRGEPCGHLYEES
jgi:mRNA interferase MazF